MNKKNIFFYGFDHDVYRNQLWNLLSKNKKFNSFKFDKKLEDQKTVIERYDELSLKKPSTFYSL